MCDAETLEQLSVLEYLFALQCGLALQFVALSAVPSMADRWLVGAPEVRRFEPAVLLHRKAAL